MQKKKEYLQLLNLPLTLLFISFIWSCNSQAPTASDKNELAADEQAQKEPGMLPTATQLITKKWEVAAYEVPEMEGRNIAPGQADVIHNAMKFLFDLQVDDVMVVFDRNGEYVTDGHWTLAQDTSVLTVSIGQETRNLRVEHFAHDHLGLSWTDTVDEIQLDIRIALSPYRTRD